MPKLNDKTLQLIHGLPEPIPSTTTTTTASTKPGSTPSAQDFDRTLDAYMRDGSSSSTDFVEDVVYPPGWDLEAARVVERRGDPGGRVGPRPKPRWTRVETMLCIGAVVVFGGPLLYMMLIVLAMSAYRF